MSQEKEFVRLHGAVEGASAETDCWKCGKSTPVHALVAADIGAVPSQQLANGARQQGRVGLQASPCIRV